MGQKFQKKCHSITADTVPDKRHRYWGIRAVLLSMFVFLITGCVTTEDYQRPSLAMPAAWRIDSRKARGMADTTWWEGFQDETLNRLIKTALEENLDLRIAAARVLEFSAALKGVKSGFYPHINYNLSADRERQSIEQAIKPYSAILDRSNNTFSPQVNLNWELDFWGKIRREKEAAQADLLSIQEGQKAVVLSLVSRVAENYFKLLSLDQELTIARQTLIQREALLESFENKLNGGQISQLEYTQVASQAQVARTYIPPIKRQIAIQENALALLLGQPPGKIERQNDFQWADLPNIPAGLPSDLLERRPDIRQAEQDLIAAHARMEIVKAQYYPTISLTGIFGFASDSLSNLSNTSANLWQLGAGAVGPLFDGGRLSSLDKQRNAQRERLVVSYIRTIQTALKEVNDALVDISTYQELCQLEQGYIKTLEEYAQYARSRYESGMSTYLPIIDSERSLYQARISHARNQYEVYAAVINTYKAMGGGWVDLAAAVPGSGVKTKENKKK